MELSVDKKNDHLRKVLRGRKDPIIVQVPSSGGAGSGTTASGAGSGTTASGAGSGITASSTSTFPPRKERPTSQLASGITGIIGGIFGATSTPPRTGPRRSTRVIPAPVPFQAVPKSRWMSSSTYGSPNPGAADF